MYTQNDMPIVKALENYISQNFIRMHMPGHQGRNNPALTKIFGSSIFAADVTELPGTDDLHAPSGVIAKAEKLAADLCAVASTIFLVNGSTQGINALMQLDKDKKIILPRHAHKALYNGLILSGAKPLYIKANILPEWNIAQGCDFDHYSNLVANNLDAAQVWLTSPTYFGHIEEINIYRKYLPDEAKLFVDEAHGAHLKLIHKPHAVDQGADAAVQSWHKSFGSFTQSAVIQFKDEELAIKVRQLVALTESTSPSYLLLASLDAARSYMATHGNRIFKDLMNITENFIYELKKFNHVRVMSNHDSTKIAVAVEGLTGYELFECLNAKGIMPELAQQRFVLLQAGLDFNKEKAEYILDVIRKVKIGKITHEQMKVLPNNYPFQALTPREAYFARKKLVNLKQAVGKIAGEYIIPYPPGIPLLVPGEEISAELLDYIRDIKKSGAKFQGCVDLQLEKIQVVLE